MPSGNKQNQRQFWKHSFEVVSCSQFGKCSTTELHPSTLMVQVLTGVTIQSKTAYKYKTKSNQRLSTVTQFWEEV
jgi:hypothetical protein